jgi:hypothetical protein
MTNNIRGKLSLKRKPTVVLSFGMGVDSSAILVEWVNNPGSRDFDLKDLLVITAMVGDEFPETGQMVEEFILPLLKKHNIRYVQVARGGRKDSEGVAVLSDTRKPTTLYLDGVYKLSDELKAAATVPQYAHGKRTCSIKYKGWVLDMVIEAIMDGSPFRHVMGFNAEEEFRAERDSSYSTVLRASEYPLIEWGWGRVACEDYLEAWCGKPWPKSCCTFCPFAGGKCEAMGRYDSDQASGVAALALEHMSLAMNPRVGLYSGTSLRATLSVLQPQVLRAFEAELAKTKVWSLYRVQRAYQGVGRAARNLACLETGTRRQMLAKLRKVKGDLVELEGSTRVFTQVPQEGVYPTSQEMYVVAPAGVANKKRASFEVQWLRALKSDTARTAGKATPKWGRLATLFVESYTKAHAQFTQGEVAVAAASEGLTPAEVTTAFKRLKKKGVLVKEGHKHRRSDEAKTICRTKPKGQLSRKDFLVPTLKVLTRLKKATNDEIYQGVCRTLGIQESDLGVQESSGKLWSHFYVARALRDLRDKTGQARSVKRAVWASV